MKLGINIHLVVKIDESDPRAWPADEGTPAEVTLAQLENGELSVDSLLQTIYEQIDNGEKLDVPTFEVTEVVE